MYFRKLLPEAVDNIFSPAFKGRYINILLTRYPGVTSKIFRMFTGDYFTHASIGVSDTDGIFYSFVTKGFRIEVPKKHPTFRKKDVLCGLYRIKVSEDVYKKAKNMLETYARQFDKYKYTRIGLVFGLFQITYKLRNRYFCSQFVLEVLEHAEVIRLSKDSSLYLPDDFMKINELDLYYRGTLRELIHLASSPTFHLA